MSDLYLGLDPGSKGCISVLNKDDMTLKFFDRTTEPWSVYFDNLIAYFDEQDGLDNKIKYAVLERVHAMPGQGVSSCFSFGVGYGYLQAFLTLCKIPYQTVLPHIWIKHMTSKSDGINPKTRSYIAAKRIFPNADFVGPRGGVKDGRTDSALMSLYASRLL